MEKDVIWKYEIEIRDDYELTIPAHGDILYLGVQNNKPYIWVKVNPYNKGVKRHFAVYGTGHSIKEKEDELIYIGSFQTHDERFVAHVFEII